jgi:hypothetical protein
VHDRFQEWRQAGLHEYDLLKGLEWAWQAMDGAMTKARQRTSLVIAHRLSTVRHADRIIVMRQGGHYAELYDTYFRHQSLSYVENARNLLGGEK